MSANIGPINAAVPTPLTMAKELDTKSTRRLCEHCRQIGLDGIFILGSMGEGRLLSEKARQNMVAAVQEELAGHLTVFASASDATAEGMRVRALQNASMGVDYVILTLPEDGTAADGIRHICKIADTCSVACGYYEVPSVTGKALTFNQLQQLLAHPNIKVFKDSSNNALIAQAITDRHLRPEGVALLDGVEFHTTYSAGLGYDGILHGGGALTARRIRRIWQLMQAGNIDEAMTLDRKNSLFLASIYDRLATSYRATIGQKYALTILGVFAHDTVLLEQELDPAARSNIAAVIRRDYDELFAHVGAEAG